MTRVEWAWARRLNWLKQPLGEPVKVRVLARRGRWVWVQLKAGEPFTVKASALTFEEPAGGDNANG
jgi:hypothetical protein